MTEPSSGWRIAIPSSVTLLGVLFGMFAIAIAPTDAYAACVGIVLASVCDMIDGRVARLTNSQSPFGAQLDSLADIISFGLAPAFLVYHWGLGGPPSEGGFDAGLLIVFGFVCCGAIRLARFNVGGDATWHFEGVPAPVGALLPTTLVMASHELDLDALEQPIVFLPVLVGASILMVSRIPFGSYKRFRSRPRQIGFYATVAGGLTMLIFRLPGGAVLLVLLTAYVATGLMSTVLGSGGAPSPPRRSP